MLSFRQAQEKMRRGNVVPTAIAVPSDTLTPVAAFLRLRKEGRGAFLLESVEGGERAARYSFLGIEPFAVLRIRNGRPEIERDGSVTRLAGNPLRALGEYLAQFRAVEDAALPRFSGGAVGWVGYEAARHAEPRLARAGTFTRAGQDGEDEARLMLFRSVAAFDHVRHRVLLISNIFADEGGAREAWKRACDDVERLRARLERPPSVVRRSSAERPRAAASGHSLVAAMGRTRFGEGVHVLKRHIRAGDIFQGVLAERFARPLRASPFALYRALRTVNPSPYMFFLDHGDGNAVLGASPEMLVRVEGGEIETCPIAGTRRRGATPEEDRRLEKSLLASPKERAEHLMLVDLGRNDVGRAARAGSVRVENFMHVERYSHVMHLVSSVKGNLRKGLTAWDAFAACFPAGTVTGAPKIRAMEILAGIEPSPRGVYAGAVVYHDFRGNLDSAIAIRSVAVRKGADGTRTAFIQAGAGVVADSSPAREWDEVNNKARAMFEAVKLAEDGLCFY